MKFARILQDLPRMMADYFEMHSYVKSNFRSFASFNFHYCNFIFSILSLSIFSVLRYVNYFFLFLTSTKSGTQLLDYPNTTSHNE